MDTLFTLIVKSLLLGFALAMDAFSVSLANGLSNPKMKPRLIAVIAATFAFFQALMPMIGWFFVHSAASLFDEFEKFIPWIALFLLSFIGGKMLIDCIKNNDCDENTCGKLTPSLLLVQGVATSIDALSVGFTISDYNFEKAFTSVIIIAVVTFAVCAAGVVIGKRFGTKLADKAGIIGGVILIAIGIEIFIKGVFFS